jgi:hypothetical protein
MTIRLPTRQSPPCSVTRGMRGSVADTRCSWTACAPGPTTTPAPSVASISYELPSCGCAVLDYGGGRLESQLCGGFVYGRVRLGITPSEKAESG